MSEVMEARYGLPLGYVVMRLGADFASARRVIIDSCKYCFGLPNIKEKEEIRQNIIDADSALEKLQDSYVRLLNAMEGSDPKLAAPKTSLNEAAPKQN